MTVRVKVLLSGLPGWWLAFALTGAQAQGSAVLDMGSQIPDPQIVKRGLFPEDGCPSENGGSACQVRAPGEVRYSLSAAAFRLGSAELPEVLRRQLQVFAEVLRGRKGGQAKVRIESHADASGPQDQAQALSQRRAESVKQYLVRQGVDPGLLVAVGMGAQMPRQADNPYAAQNRRIEIGRTVLN